MHCAQSWPHDRALATGRVRRSRGLSPEPRADTFIEGKRDVAQIARSDGLVDATPESIRELADSAMLSPMAHTAQSR